MLAVLCNQDKIIKTKMAVSDQREHRADYTNDNKESDRCQNKQKNLPSSKKQDEIRVVNRFLPVFNQKKLSAYLVGPNQPAENSHVDVIVVDIKSHKKLNIQVRVSDDAPWAALARTKLFKRLSIGFVTHHNAIKKAIESKIKKYPLETRKDIILLLDGWLAVRSEDLQEFKTTELQFLSETGFKEIWFVGASPDTITELSQLQDPQS